MKLSIQFRYSRRGAWKRCYSAWSFEDIAYLNKTVGYEKYRVTHVTVGVA